MSVTTHDLAAPTVPAAARHFRIGGRFKPSASGPSFTASLID
jgi:hypothetical protein